MRISSGLQKPDLVSSHGNRRTRKMMNGGQDQFIDMENFEVFKLKPILDRLRLR